METAHGSVLYKAAVALRHRVLREPLGLAFTEEQLEAEKTQTHLVCLDGQQVIACAALVPQDVTTVKLRQMAVAPLYQGRYIGQQLLAYAEDVARAKSYERIVLHARETAIGFYEKSGFATTGEPFVDVTLPHRKMVKKLTIESLRAF